MLIPAGVMLFRTAKPCERAVAVAVVLLLLLLLWILSNGLLQLLLTDRCLCLVFVLLMKFVDFVAQSKTASCFTVGGMK